MTSVVTTRVVAIATVIVIVIPVAVDQMRLKDSTMTIKKVSDLDNEFTQFQQESSQHRAPNRARSPFRSWEGLKRRLLERFQLSQEGTLYEQFLAITQEGSAHEYVNLFETLAGQLVGIPEEVMKGTFIKGLRPELWSDVRVMQPEGLNRAMIIDENKAQSSSQVAVPAEGQTTIKGGHFRRMTESEPEERRAKGLCFLCEKFQPGHRYGYKDVHRENHQIFEQLLIESLEKFIRREAKERSLESDRDDDTDSEDESPHVLLDPSGTVYSLGAPLLSKYKNKISKRPVISEPSTSREPGKDPNNSAQDKSLENELSILHMAKELGIVYLLGHERDSNSECAAHTVDGSGHHPHGLSCFHMILRGLEPTGYQLLSVLQLQFCQF
nr:potassium transporter 7 [Tanacetum cinerariifolium]